jgi:hypothetical protein
MVKVPLGVGVGVKCMVEPMPGAVGFTGDIPAEREVGRLFGVLGPTGSKVESPEYEHHWSQVVST